MILWIDAQLSPALAPWLAQRFDLNAVHVRDLSLRNAEDPHIYREAQEHADVVMSKDRDFVELVRRYGPPPRVLWITCGNTSNAHLRTLFELVLPAALDLINQGESIVEITDAKPKLGDKAR